MDAEFRTNSVTNTSPSPSNIIATHPNIIPTDMENKAFTFSDADIAIAFSGNQHSHSPLPSHQSHESHQSYQLYPPTHSSPSLPCSSSQNLIHKSLSNDIPTEITITSISYSSREVSSSSSHCFLKIIQNLSSMIFYCLSQLHPGVDKEISNHFDDHEDVHKWNIASIDSYLWMVVEDSQIDYACLICGIIYLNRALKSPKYNVYLTSGNWRNFVSTCFLISSKMFDDLGMSNADFRNIFPTTELARVNSFELTLCLLLEFNLYVTEKDYQTYRRRYDSAVTPGSSRRNSTRALTNYVAPTFTSTRHVVEIEPEIPKTSAVPVNINLNSLNISLPSPQENDNESSSNPPSYQGLAFEPYPKKSRSFLDSLQQGIQSFLPSGRRGRSAPDVKKIYCA